MKIIMIAATLPGTISFLKGHVFCHCFKGAVRLGANAQTWTWNTKHRHVVLNTGYYRVSVGPISSERHRSCCRACVTSAGSLGVVCLRKGAWSVPPHLGAIPGLWDCWGFLALTQFPGFHRYVSLCGMKRGVLPHLMKVLGDGACSEPHKHVWIWYVVHFQQLWQLFHNIISTLWHVFWQCWGQILFQGPHSLWKQMTDGWKACQ